MLLAYGRQRAGVDFHASSTQITFPNIVPRSRAILNWFVQNVRMTRTALVARILKPVFPSDS